MNENHSVLDLLDDIYSEVNNARAVPLVSLREDKCIVNRNTILAALSNIRSHLPAEMEVALRVSQMRDDVINDAHAKAESLRTAAEEAAKTCLQNARQQADYMVSTQAVYLEAQQRASQIIANAEAKSRAIYEAAVKYLDSVLATSEQSLGSAYNDVRQTREQFLKNTGGSRNSAAQ